jgi:hypothetical protein
LFSTARGLTNSQLTRMADERVACSIIRDHIDSLQAYNDKLRDEEAEDEDDVTPVPECERVSLGARQPPKTIQELAANAPVEFSAAFGSLLTKITGRLNAMKFGKDKRLVRLRPEHEVCRIMAILFIITYFEHR